MDTSVMMPNENNIVKYHFLFSYMLLIALFKSLTTDMKKIEVLFAFRVCLNFCSPLDTYVFSDPKKFKQCLI